MSNTNKNAIVILCEIFHQRNSQPLSELNTKGLEAHLARGMSLTSPCDRHKMLFSGRVKNLGRQGYIWILIKKQVQNPSVIHKMNSLNITNAFLAYIIVVLYCKIIYYPSTFHKMNLLNIINAFLAYFIVVLYCQILY